MNCNFCCIEELDTEMLLQYISETHCHTKILETSPVNLSSVETEDAEMFYFGLDVT